MIAVLIVVGLVVAGLVIGYVAVSNAPVGFQDETGFHYGPDHQSAQVEVAAAVAHGKLA